MQKSVCLLGVTWRKRAQTGSFIPNAADGQARLGVTEDIVNLLCHFVCNRTILIFVGVMFFFCIENTKRNTSMYTFDMDTLYYQMNLELQ